ncbi:MAG: carboxynorspermidine decarboxylase [Cytophagales bacterium]|nr:carboxynorspermidine decarboxylase [Cytophagales bacterium]
MHPDIPFHHIPSPCYILDEKLLYRNLKLISKVSQEAGVKIILALKGFSMYGAFDIVKKYLPGTTASSLNEAKLAYHEYGGEVHAYCVAYLAHEMDEMMQYCGHITFNSISQWQKYKDIIQKHSKNITCGIRINPQYSEVDTDLYNPSIPGSRLGMTYTHLGNTLPQGIEGLHFHNLCEGDSYALERTLQAVETKFGHLIAQCKWFNMGGGHLMTHEKYNTDHLIHILTSFKARYPNLQEVILEPGSAIAWQTGYLLATVQDVIENGGKITAVIDASVSAHMPDCIEMPYTAKIYGAAAVDEGKYVYKIGGLTCLAGDHMGPYSFDKPLEAGSQIVFDDMMHYTMVKTTTFNGVNLPNIGIWRESGKFELLKSFGYEEYKARL